MAAEYEKLPVPGFTSPTKTYTNPEILYSTKGGFTQKGVTLGANQGVLPAGRLLGQKTSDKKYYSYDNSASDGTQTARGVLRSPTDTTGSDMQANIVIAGILKLNMVTTAGNSTADAASLTDLGATTDTVRGTFKF